MYTKDDLRLLTCYHCGNKGLLAIKYKHAVNLGVYATEDSDADEPDYIDHYSWYLLSCPVCNKVSLLQEYYDDFFSDCVNPETKLLYPEEGIDYAKIPQKIRKSFDIALKIKRIDNEQCSASLRKVLELICVDKGAKNGKLEAMIEEMIRAGVFPEMYRDACYIVRKIGNNAVHAKSRKFTSYQVEQTIEFIKNMIYYLYILPDKMRNLRKQVDEIEET